MSISWEARNAISNYLRHIRACYYKFATIITVGNPRLRREKVEALLDAVVSKYMRHALQSSELISYLYDYSNVKCEKKGE